jgi:phage major head subunit gpT-like protein
MGMTGNIDAANTAFTTAVSDVLSGSAQSVHAQFTDVIEAEGESIEVLVCDGLPMMREWVGAKQYHDLRVYRANYPIRQWESTFALPGVKVRGDKTGLVAKRVGEFAGRIPSMLDKIVIDSMLANALNCYDGTTLLSNSHANVGTGGTSDNLTTSALSFAEFKTAVQAVEETADENGKFLGLQVTHLLVGTAQKRIGMEVTGSMRPVPAKNDGTFDGTSSIVAAPLLQNYLGGSVQLIVSPYITGNEWFAMSLNQPGVRPYGLAVFRSAHEIPLVDESDPARFDNDEYRWSIEADLTPFPMAWHTIYGSVTA